MKISELKKIINEAVEEVVQETIGLDAAKKVAILFHETYERLAPSFGYETRQDTKKFDPESKNGKLMIAVCSEVLAGIDHESSEERERLAWEAGFNLCRQYGDPQFGGEQKERQWAKYLNSPARNKLVGSNGELKEVGKVTEDVFDRDWDEDSNIPREHIKDADEDRLDALEDKSKTYWVQVQSQPSGDMVWDGQGVGLRKAIDKKILDN